MKKLMIMDKYRLATILAAVLIAGSIAKAQTTIGGSVYGGGALANTGDTQVKLTGGTVNGNVYGGGMGRKAVAAIGTEGADGYVPAVAAISATVGNATVELNRGVANNARGCVVNRSIFGCNNINGTPTGTVTVHVYATQNAAASTIANPAEGEQTAKVKGRYDLAAVYGGGNEAAYEPTDNNLSTNVIIEGCDLTSIDNVYGGGNAASAPGTKVTVNSCFEIHTLFAGGNGAGEGNPGANVGYKYFEFTADPEKSEEENATAEAAVKAAAEYGPGTSYADLKGGTIHSAFGGSNTKGNIRVSATVDLNEPTPNTCPLLVEEVYGAGRNAGQDGNANILLGCITYLKEIYGGAENADINADVVLTIQSGRFDRVFGGNNLGGNINGTITVNIEETGCHPIIIGQLYGGGNQAAYTAPTGKHGPTVNVKSFTSIGEIYGGGYGASAVVNGDTYVYIDECVGENANAEMKKKVDENTGIETSEDSNVSAYTDIDVTINEGEDDEVTIHQPEHKAGEIGAIGNVFGGGNAAKVDGNTIVNIGTLEYVEMASVTEGADVTGYYTRSGEGTSDSPYEAATGTAVKNTTYYKKVTGVDIRGNVYGGGNNAEVTGDTNVIIGSKIE